MRSFNRRRFRDTGAAFLFLSPLLLLVVGLIAYPFTRAIWLSLTDKLVGYPERFVGLRNYAYLLDDDTFHEVVRNTLVFTAGSLVLKVITGLARAHVLPRPLFAAVDHLHGDHRADLALDVRRLSRPRLFQQRAAGRRPAGP